MTVVISVEEFLDRKKGVIRSAQEFADLIEFEQEHGWPNNRYEMASTEVWFEILDTRPDLVNAITLYKRLPDSVLIRLARHDSRRIRSFILSKGKLPGEVFEILASDRDEDIVLGVAYHRLTPEPVLRRLAGNPRVAIAVTAEANLLTRVETMQAEVMWQLARDSRAEVRRRLVDRTDLPAGIFEFLASDEDDDVIRRILINKKTPASALEIIVASGRGGPGARLRLERKRTTDTNRLRNGRAAKQEHPL